MSFQDKIQAKISRGYAKAAARLGSQFVQYRVQTFPVISETNIVQELYFAFDMSDSFSFAEPLDYNKAKYYALFDNTNAQIGDYFYDYTGRTFFISNLEPLKPPEVILCNETLSLYRPAGSTGVSNGYGGDTTPALYASGVPVSLLPESRGEANESGLPGAIRAPWMQVLIPPLAGIDVKTYDLFIDSQNRRWIVSMCSLAKEGWYTTVSYQSA